MSLYAVWPYLAMVAGVLLVLRVDPVFRMIDRAAPEAGDRFSTIDGLRGFLAFGVFGHHAMVTHEYLRTGIWKVPPSVFYTLLGQAGVSLFFAVTGFLFWGKLLSARGMVDWRELYIGRFFRIAPIYLAVVIAMLFVAADRTNFELRESLYTVCREIARWLTLGVLGQPDVNGYEHTGLLLAGVTWTLRYEWLYYLSLPLLAVFATGSRHLAFVSAGLASCLLLYAVAPSPHALYASLFLCGMIAASLRHAGFRVNLGGKWGFVIGLLCLGMLFAGFPTVYGVGQVLLLGMVFYIVSTGNAFLGVLKWKCSRRLGEISYSVYLMHGLILTCFFSIDAVRNYALKSSGCYWLAIALCALLVILASSLGYVLIERPGIGFGKKVAARSGPLLSV